MHIYQTRMHIDQVNYEETSEMRKLAPEQCVYGLICLKSII